MSGCVDSENYKNKLENVENKKFGSEICSQLKTKYN